MSILRTLLTRVIMAAMMLVAGSPAWADESCSFELQDGEITEHRLRGVYGYIRISVPPEPPPEAGYPVVFYYHGASTNLKPNVRIMHAVTGGHDYLLVGMNYRKKHFYTNLDRRNLRLEISHFEEALEKVAACRPVNRKAVFLAGYSQGGYAISMIGEQRVASIAGMVFLGSGRRHAKMYMEEAEAVKGLPMFFGAGENDDPHFHYAVTSAQLYSLMGAEVSMESWPETNHGAGWSWYIEYPARGAGLKDWLDKIVARNQQIGQ